MRGLEGGVGDDSGMANRYRPVDREQAFLLPPDMGQWLEPGHFVWFVIDAVEALDTSAFHDGRRLGGRGRQGWDPDMLLALLIYCYAQGRRSSRRIEALCCTDVACRVICANQRPDHTAIARFRAEHEAAFKTLFAQVVGLCVRQGAGRVGTLAIDGTKIAADASRWRNRTREVIEAEIDGVVAEAVAVDAAEDAEHGSGRGDELPPGLADPRGRVARLRRAVEQIRGEEEQAVARASRRVEHNRMQLEAVRAAQQAKVDRYRRRQAAGVTRPGPEPTPVDQHSEVRRIHGQLQAAQRGYDQARRRARYSRRGHQRRRNTTDPDSALLRSHGAWVQGYNAQAAFSADGIALAAMTLRGPKDAPALMPLVQQVAQTLIDAGSSRRIGTVLADAGYYSKDNLAALGDTCGPGPRPQRVLIPPPAAAGRRPGSAPHAARMRQVLNTDEGHRVYAKRAWQAEGPFGHITTALGFTRFSRRGLNAVDSEWHLILAVRNLLSLHRRGMAPA